MKEQIDIPVGVEKELKSGIEPRFMRAMSPCDEVEAGECVMPIYNQLSKMVAKAKSHLESVERQVNMTF